MSGHVFEPKGNQSSVGFSCILLGARCDRFGEGRIP